jgi:hypothetical protein
MPLLGNRSRADLCRTMGLLRDSCRRFEAPGRGRASTDRASISEVLPSSRLSENPIQPRPRTRAILCVVVSQSNQSDIARVCKVMTLGPARTRFRRAR